LFAIDPVVCCFNLQVNDLADRNRGIWVCRVVEVELVEQLWEPEPEPVVAELDGEVDHHHDDCVSEE